MRNRSNTKYRNRLQRIILCLAMIDVAGLGCDNQTKQTLTVNAHATNTTEESSTEGFQLDDIEKVDFQPTIAEFSFLPPKPYWMVTVDLSDRLEAIGESDYRIFAKIDGASSRLVFANTKFRVDSDKDAVPLSLRISSEASGLDREFDYVLNLKDFALTGMRTSIEETDAFKPLVYGFCFNYHFIQCLPAVEKLELALSEDESDWTAFQFAQLPLADFRDGNAELIRKLRSVPVVARPGQSTLHCRITLANGDVVVQRIDGEGRISNWSSELKGLLDEDQL